MKISNDIRIFIVENDATQAQILQDKLLEYNPDFDITQFKSGEDLVSYFTIGFQKNKLNYIILDYYLQSEENKEAINGFEVITKLKNKFPKSKVIVYSAFDSDGDSKFDSLKEEPIVLEVIKKSDYSVTSLQNILRFDYSKESLRIKKRRFNWAALGFIVICFAAFIYFYSTNYFF